MRKYLIGIMCIGFMALIGCANVSYSTPSGEKFNYNRLGMLKLDGFELEKETKDGSKVSVKFNKSESGAGDLAEAILNLTNKIP